MRSLRAWIREIVGRVSGALDAADRAAAPARTPARVLGAVAVLALAIIAVSGPVTLAAPRTCSTCHASAYTRWQASPHATAGCGTCHTERSAALGLGNSVGLVADVSRLGSGPGASGSKVPNSACLSCHPVSKLVQLQLTASGLRMSHKGLIGSGHRCTDCHAGVAHALPAARVARPTMSACATCHNNVRVSGRCTICHAEASSKVQAREVDPEWQKTHGPDWKSLHGMGDLTTCTLCHAKTECETCHGIPMPHDETFITSHGATAQQKPQACITCHQQTFCSDCHGIQMPHPAGFLKQHPTVAKQPNAPCLRCHTQANCDECHQAHVHANGLGR